MLKLKKIKIFVLSAVCVLCALFGAATMNFAPSYAEGSGFSMQNGAYLKVSGGEKGIRFVTDITDAKYASLTETYGEENLEFGTLFLPTALITEDNALTLENVASETNEAGAMKRVITSWVIYPEETGVRSFVSVLKDIPESRYNAGISARSYVLDKVSGVVEYTETVSRSVSSVALAAYADTNVKDEEVKGVLMNSYLSGKTFANLSADKISYDATKISLSVTEDGKINAKESGTGRAWNNVFFGQGLKAETGKTYYFSFDLNVLSADCDLFLGAVTAEGKRINIHHDAEPYKKLASGTITATYTAKEDASEIKLFIFSNADTAEKAYSYEYTADNFQTFCTDYESKAVFGGGYKVKLSNDTGDNPKPEYTEFTRKTSVLTENAVGTVTANKVQGWQGIFVDFGTLKAGTYTLSFKVSNVSGQDIYLYSRQFKNNVQSGLTDFNSVANGETRTCTVKLELSENTDYMIRIFSANNGGKAFVKFEVGALTLTRTGVLNGGSFGVFITGIEGSNGATFSESVQDESLYTANVIGTATCGEGGETLWRGIKLALAKTQNGGKYIVTFKVTNRGESSIPMYSQIAGNFSEKITEHGALASGETKVYKVEIAADEAVSASVINIQIFSMNAAGHTFELGDVSIDFTPAN